MIQLDDLQRGDRIKILDDAKPPRSYVGDFIQVERLLGRWWVSIDEGHTIPPDSVALTSIPTGSIQRIERLQPARTRQ